MPRNIRISPIDPSSKLLKEIAIEGGGGPSFMLCVYVLKEIFLRGFGKRERKEGGLLKDGCFTCVLGGDAVPQVPSLMIFFCFKGDFVCFSLEHL